MDLDKEINIRDRMWCIALINGCKDPNEIENVVNYFNVHKDILEKEAISQVEKIKDNKIPYYQDPKLSPGGIPYRPNWDRRDPNG